MREGIIKRIFGVYVIVAACVTATPSYSEERHVDQARNAFSIRWENDTFGGTDANYTNGMSLALSRSGEGLIGGVWALFGEPEGRRFAVYDLGQLQFTPNDIGRQNPDPNDCPYAGFLYLGLTTFLRNEDSLHGIKLFAGVVGPISLSESVQKATHRLIGYNLPQGWNYQIKNEPVVNLLYEYRHKFHLAPRDGVIGIELLPIGGGMLGNFLIQAQVEAQLRIGYQLPDDFGVTVLRGIGFLPMPLDTGTHRAWGIYAFVGGGVNLIARDLVLDGNTFADSRSVDKRPILPAVEFGASLWARPFQASFSYVMWGKEFYGQQVREDYGSILLSCFF